MGVVKKTVKLTQEAAQFYAKQQVPPLGETISYSTLRHSLQFSGHDSQSFFTEPRPGSLRIRLQKKLMIDIFKVAQPFYLKTTMLNSFMST